MDFFFSRGPPPTKPGVTPSKSAPRGPPLISLRVQRVSWLRLGVLPLTLLFFTLKPTYIRKQPLVWGLLNLPPLSLTLPPPIGYTHPPWKRGTGEVESRALTSEQDRVGTPPNFALGSRCMPGACQSYVVKLPCRACSYSSIAKRSNARSITTFNDPILHVREIAGINGRAFPTSPHNP
jgi:hypothetical protein